MTEHKESSVLARFASPLLILATIIWGSSFVVMKSSVDVLPTFWLLAIRFSFAALVLAVGAGATGGLKTVAQAFAGVFGPTADTQVMDQIGYPIGASDTDNGVTVTAEAILFDGYNYLMTYSIAREDGTAFSVEEIPQGEGRLNLTWDSADSTIGRNTTGAHGSSYFYDADPTDAAIQYVETMSYHEQAQAGGTVKITLQDLRTVGDRETASQVLAEGTWNLKFQLKAGDLSVRLPVGQTLEWNGMTATIDALGQMG